jgi:hypothetical protein
VSDGHIDKVFGAGGAGSGKRGFKRGLVDGFELRRFGWAGVSDSGQMDVGGLGGDGLLERRNVEGVAGNGRAAEGKFTDGLGAGEGVHIVTGGYEGLGEWPAEVAGAAADEDFGHVAVGITTAGRQRIGF